MNTARHAKAITIEAQARVEDALRCRITDARKRTALRLSTPKHSLGHSRARASAFTCVCIARRAFCVLHVGTREQTCVSTGELTGVGTGEPTCQYTSVHA